MVCCLVIAIVGITVLARMPVDLFPPINIPVVVVATFYSGMPPEQIETDITGRFERFFTLGSNIDHIESRSLPGVSLFKIYFQPGTDPDADLSEISNLAMADLRKLPPGTLPPVVLKFDASSLPVCLAQRNRIARPWAIQRSQPSSKRPRRIRTAAFRRTVSADYGLCRSVEIGRSSTERHGRCAHGQRQQLDSSCR